MVSFAGTITSTIKVLEPCWQSWLRTINVTKVEDLRTVRSEDFIQNVVRNDVNRGARRGHGSQNTRLISSWSAFSENRTNHHLAKVSVLSFTHCVHSSTLAN